MGRPSYRIRIYDSMDGRMPQRFRSQNQNAGEDGRKTMWGSSYSSEKGWLETRYELFTDESGECDRDFLTGQSFGSVGAGFNGVPAFWSCANKMMIYMLKKAERPDGHSIRPRSLKVATIPPPYRQK